LPACVRLARNETKDNKMNGKLYLIPTVIAEHTQALVIPEQVRRVLPTVTHFLAEDIRTARRYLSSLKVYESIEALSFYVLDKKTKEGELKELFLPIAQGHNLGVLSESGCPGVADPGALAVKYAHQHNIQVVPLVGPSSLLLALMASGLNGQRFAFQGYLPIDGKDRVAAIKELENESKKKNQTQLFIETPYRNQTVFTELVKTLSPSTYLCVAYDVTGSAERVTTKTVSEWRKETLVLEKMPCVFLLLAY
jgi:16S rRNA (cytidine1402-2'-O)-methyltransferase